MPVELCARARDRMWQCNASATLRRDDPSTWTAPLPDDDASDDPANVWGKKRWQLRSVGGEEIIMDMLPRSCVAMATQLLGDGGFYEPTGGPFLGRNSDTGAFLAPPGSATRGIYCTLPESEDAPRVPLRDQPGIHFDSGVHDDSRTDGRFKVTGLIDDTPPGQGGFTLYPRSHSRLYELAVGLRADGLDPGSDEGHGRLRSLVEAIAADTEPVDCHGPCGTVVFWHRCTAHKVAENYTDTIRQAVIYVSAQRVFESWRMLPR